MISDTHCIHCQYSQQLKSTFEPVKWIQMDHGYLNKLLLGCAPGQNRLGARSRNWTCCRRCPGQRHSAQPTARVLNDSARNCQFLKTMPYKYIFHRMCNWFTHVLSNSAFLISNYHVSIPCVLCHAMNATTLSPEALRLCLRQGRTCDRNCEDILRWRLPF